MWFWLNVSRQFCQWKLTIFFVCHQSLIENSVMEMHVTLLIWKIEVISFTFEKYSTVDFISDVSSRFFLHSLFKDMVIEWRCVQPWPWPCSSCIIMTFWRKSPVIINSLLILLSRRRWQIFGSIMTVLGFEVVVLELRNNMINAFQTFSICIPQWNFSIC